MGSRYRSSEDVRFGFGGFGGKDGGCSCMGRWI